MHQLAPDLPYATASVIPVFKKKFAAAKPGQVAIECQTITLG
jgi:hypothetical protein